MPMTAYTMAGLQNYLYGKTSVFDTQLTEWWVHLWITPPNTLGAGGTRVTAGDYSPVQTLAADWNSATAADPSVMDNANLVDFGTATSSWGTVTGFTIEDDNTGSGNIIHTGSLNSSMSVVTNDDVTFPAGSLNTSLQSPA